MKEITVRVPQGIGDIWWCAQTLIPHFDKINYQIVTIQEHPVHKVHMRAHDWLFLFPKTGSVSFHPVPAAEYKRMLMQVYPLKSIIGQGPGPFYYALNKPLEEGTRLEAISPEYEVAWDVPIRTEPHQLTGSEYVLLYCSAHFTNPLIWPVMHWVTLVDELYKRNSWKCPLVLIGASYDEKATRELANLLTARGIKNSVLIDTPPAQAAGIIKHAKFFIGYQSGLSILADNFNVPQLMMYIARPDAWMAPAAKGQRLLMYSWPKKDNIARNIYQAATFSMAPIDVANFCQGIKPAPVKTTPGSKVLLTCGLGDFMVIEALLTEEERNKVETIFYATPARNLVQKFLELAKPFPNLKKEVILFDKFSDALPSIGYKHQLTKLPLNVNANLDDIQDWGVILFGTAFLNGTRTFQSTCLKKPVADISDLYLPSKYVAIHPYSARCRTPLRDLALEEWDAITAWLDRINVPGIIVNEGAERMPQHHLVRDLSNELTLGRAIEVVKHASAFAGAASCFSIVASKFLPKDRLFIKCHEELRNRWGRFYYAPHQDGQFVYPSLHFLSELGPQI